MNNEEKILALLSEMRTDISGLKTDVADLKTDVADLKTDVADLKTDVAGIKIRLDLEIEKKLDLLAEGHQVLLDTLAPKTKTEELEENYILLRSAVAALSKEVAELKKAQ